MPDSRVFVSRVHEPAGRRYSRREAFAFDGSGFTFLMDKEHAGEEEFVVGKTYFAADVEERLGLCVSIDGPESDRTRPSESWSARKIRFDFRPGELGEVVALGGTGRDRATCGSLDDSFRSGSPGREVPEYAVSGSAPPGGT